MVEVDPKSLHPAASAPLGLQVKIKFGSQIGKSEKVTKNVAHVAQEFYVTDFLSNFLHPTLGP